MKSTIILCLSLLTIVVSCTTYQPESVVEENLTGRNISVDSANFHKKPIVLLNDIAITKKRDNYFGSLFTKEGWHKGDTLLSIGRGHNEFQLLLFSKGKNNSLYMLNVPYTGTKPLSLTVVEKTDSFAIIRDATKWKQYDLKNMKSFSHGAGDFVACSDSSLLFSGTLYDAPKHLFSILNYMTQEVIPLDYWPDDGKEIDSFAKLGVYADNCRLVGNGNGYYFYQCRGERFAFIFSIEGNKVKIIKELYSTFPEYKQDQSYNYVMTSTSPEKMLSFANNYNIYTLLINSDCNGKKLEKYINPYVFGNTVEVFDWEGNKQKIIHLDHYGEEFMISDDNTTLYLFSGINDGQVNVWAYDISEK